MTENSNDKIAETSWVDLGPVGHFSGAITGAQLPSGLRLAVHKVGDDFFITSDRCTHGGASFAEEGELEGSVLECAWHKGSFDVRTGAALTLPCRTPLPTFGVRVSNGHLYASAKPNRRQ